MTKLKVFKKVELTLSHLWPPHTTLLVIGMLVTTTINVMTTTATAMLLLLVMAHVRRMKGLTTPAISSIKTWTL
jgi:hypothetical protein